MYNPQDWYWDNGATVFSSARQQRVAYSDAAYLAWLAAGNRATADPGNQQLRDLLSPYGIGLSPAETAKLQAIAAFVARPDLLARLVGRLLVKLKTQGVLTQADVADLLGTSAQTDPNS